MCCEACGADNPTANRFCGTCGAPLVGACPACGQPNPPTNRFCGQCGSPLVSGVGSQVPGVGFASPDTRQPTPDAYTPSHLAEKILASRAALEGERKQVTILFADLKGSMELLADRDPEEARKLLDPVLERMMEAVHRYEGTVNQVMGDGIMALFGAPLAHEEHAVRACYAALAMQESVTRCAEEVRRAHGVNVQMRVGLNSGEVVVRAIGSDLHMDYTAVGQTTHLAARMEQLAMPGSVLATSETVKLVEGYVQVRPLGPVAVKGLSEPAEIFELLGAGSVRTRLQAAAARGLTRFVGRAIELEQLHRAQQLAGDGHGQVVAVVGEAGVGKSRLVYELTHSDRLAGWLVLESASVSYGKATSYLPVIELLKRYFKIQDRDELREIREKVTGKLLALDRSLEPTLPALLALLDVPVEDARWQVLDPPQRRQRTLEAVRGLVLREAREQPLLLIFEDLHWIDSETQALLDLLVESLGAARLLLLVNYRPEYIHVWSGKTYYSQTRLHALPTESAGELLEALLGDDASLEPLKAMLTERTDGNPFFLEESVRSFVESGLLTGQRGAYRLSAPLAASRVPATVQAVLAARIDRLPPEEKRLLQTAAVVGKDVPDTLLRAVADDAEEELRRGLAGLQTAEFLYEASLFPELEYTFKHALTQEVAYGSLLRERRRELHGRVVEAIERLYPDRLDEHLEQLAHHALRGQVWERAVAYARSAGEKAAARSAYREALSWFEQALTGTQHLPECRDTLELALDIRLDVGAALGPLSAWDRVLEHLHEAEEIAETLEDRGRQSGIRARMAESFRQLGRHDEAVEASQRALRLAEEIDDRALQVYVMFQLACAHRNRGEFRRAANAFRFCVEGPVTTMDLRHFSLSRITVAVLLARPNLAWTLGELGEFDEAVAQGTESLRVCEASGKPSAVVVAYNTLGGIHLERGDVARAVILIERGLDLARTGDSVNPLMWSLALRGACHTLAGQASLAVLALERCLDMAGNVSAADYALWATWLGQAYLAAGRIAEARQTVMDALARAVAQQERGNRVVALRALGEIAASGESPVVAEAVQRYREALMLAEALEMRPVLAHCHLGLGKLYERTGQLHEAREHVRSAATMYREMDMPFWLEQAEAQLGELK